MKPFTKISLVLMGLFVLILNACAIADSPTATPLPQSSFPIVEQSATLELRLEGSCRDAPELLENWLGTTLTVRQNFLSILETWTEKSQDDIRYELVRVSEMKDSVVRLIAPDCTQQAHPLLTEALSIAETGFQQFLNGQINDLSSVIADVRSRMDIVVRIQDDLLASFSGSE